NDFDMFLRSLANGPAGRAVSPHAAINYLLFRVYEAAKQLERFGGRRIAVAVFDNQMSHPFGRPLRGNWIDWSTPHFLPADPVWESCLQRQDAESYPRIRTDVAPAVKAIDAVWIMKRSYGYKYSLEYEIPTG